ncbi:uncharacterized protein L969DRAFT_51354 [Mixia osmundae IAM 14324]|uniref:Nucleoporin Nup133/Nup155-like N-terminal domain-containing protein n=1 Tax=Mixia osmundae (strain CBS 9802 / IAM 14324 / JCM 22182 / KY 12970) TaxID=764103 RepID=G7EAM3_MIXOS|nr:uncharacterized protein L969DRAFT_51354 [Mixia osmundae IAM 14324]KEI38202.1 hypothetical protein L969DRAFT_51354 [Mixia osmundae IAM 14324]GAA99883.1 hypothetical protein E5Q_06586 [Mixia osmundae IAM 14324]
MAGFVSPFARDGPRSAFQGSSSARSLVIGSSATRADSKELQTTNARPEGQAMSDSRSNPRKDGETADQKQSETQPDADPHFAALARASAVVDARIARESKPLDLADLLSTSSVSGTHSVSPVGQYGNGIASQQLTVHGDSSTGEYKIPPNLAWQPFVRKRLLILPDQSFTQYDLNRARCAMGIFPEISRAWITVDHRLFLWEYESSSSNGAPPRDLSGAQADGSASASSGQVNGGVYLGGGFSSYEGLNEVIVALALVEPKRDILVKAIDKVLVLATPVSIHLLGLGWLPPTTPAGQPASNGPMELTLYETQLQTSTNRAVISSIVGHENGRIFAAAEDGDLYEVLYASAEGFFRKRCQLIKLTGSGWPTTIMPLILQTGAAQDPVVSLVIDSSRQSLYALTKQNNIELYSLGKDGSLAAPVRQVRHSDVCARALQACNGSNLLDRRTFAIAKLMPIPTSQSKTIGLVAITTKAVRIYFAVRRTYYSASSGSGCLDIVHVRLPPSPSPSPAPGGAAPRGMSGQIPSNPIIPYSNILAATYASDGLLIAAHNISPEADVLFTAAPDVGRLAQAVLTNPRIPLAEWAGQIAIDGQTWAIEEKSRSASDIITQGQFAIEEIASQATAPAREFLVLTNMGMYVLSRHRPIDVLLALLQTSSSRDIELSTFLSSFGRDQSCAMCLHIAAGGSVTQSASPTSAFESGKIASLETRQLAKQLFYETGGRPTLVNRSYGAVSDASMTSPDGRVIYSGRHEGLALATARLLRPIWKLKIAKLSPEIGNPNRIIASLAEATLTTIQREILALSVFVSSEFQVFLLTPDAGNGRPEQESVAVEQDSLAALRVLLTQTVEAISFVLLLIDYRLPDVLATCAPELRQAVLDLTYQDLLTLPKGRETTRGLVSAIINHQIGQNINIDVISDVLQQRCGSFCSSDDVLLYKAAENLKKASTSAGAAEKLEHLRESHHLYFKAVRHLSIDQLRDLARQYADLDSSPAAVSLALHCAVARDPSGRGLAWWQDGRPANDPREPNFASRQACYEVVISILEAADARLDETFSKANKAPELASDHSEADANRQNTIAQALRSDDPAFHWTLYDWYMAKKTSDALLDIRTDFLPAYLRQEPISVERYALLWQLHSRSGEYQEAARILLALGDSEALNLTLEKRIEYFSMAVSNAKSQFPDPTTQQETLQMLTDAEEKLEVAQVQVETWRAVLDHTAISDEDKESAINRLDQRLFTITELYDLFAEPYHLLEVILLIFHVSDHYDAFRTRETWSAILDRALLQPNNSQVDYLTRKITELARRFYPSDFAMPIDLVVSLVAELGQRHPSTARPGWLVTALREANIPSEVIYRAYDGLIRSRLPPWHLNNAVAHLTIDVAPLFGQWLQDVLSQAGREYDFPAAEVEASLAHYLLTLDSSNVPAATETRSKLKDVQMLVQRRF